LTYHPYVRRPASPKVGRPALIDRATDHGRTNTSHTPTEAASTRVPLRPSAIATHAKHTRLHGTKNDLVNAPSPSAAPRITAGRRPAVGWRSRSMAPKARSIAAPLNRSGVVSSSGIMVRARTPN